MVEVEKEIKTCHIHGEYEAQSFYVGGAKIQSGCAKCIEELEKTAVQESDAGKLELKRIKAARVEPEHYACSLENYVATTDAQKHAKELVSRFIAGEFKKLFLVGKNGTGKTHLSVACLRSMGGKRYTMYEISAMIRASYSMRGEKTELDIVEELSSIPLLVIDEIGRTKGGDAERNWLSAIIDKRHTRNLPVVLISNNHFKSKCGSNGCEKCLENYFDEDVISRFHGGKQADFSWEDYRRKHGS